jgi:hypothetical protein
MVFEWDLSGSCDYDGCDLVHGPIRRSVGWIRISV